MVQNQTGQKTAAADGASEPRNGRPIASSKHHRLRRVANFRASKHDANRDASELLPAFLNPSRECVGRKPECPGFRTGLELILQNSGDDLPRAKPSNHLASILPK